jgi:hypothetical protein
VKRLLIATLGLNCAIMSVAYIGLQFVSLDSSILGLLLVWSGAIILFVGIPQGILKSLLSIEVRRPPYLTWSRINQASLDENLLRHKLATAIFLWPPAVTLTLSLTLAFIFFMFTLFVKGDSRVALGAGIIGLLAGSLTAFFAVIIPMTLGILVYMPEIPLPKPTVPTPPAVGQIEPSGYFQR